MSTPTTDTTPPPTWAGLIRLHTDRFVAEGHAPGEAAVLATQFVDERGRDEAHRVNAMVGPWHLRFLQEAPKQMCGLTVGVVASRKSTDNPDNITCPDCRIALDRLLVAGRAGLYGQANPGKVKAALNRLAETYMRDTLGMPPWAMPDGTARTPLHPLSVQIRTLAGRRLRKLARLTTALEAHQGQVAQALETIGDGGLPSWTQVEPGPAVDVAAVHREVMALNGILPELAASLVAACSEVDQWIKQENPGAQAPEGAGEVVAAALVWRDVLAMRDLGRVYIDAMNRLEVAVDAYRAAGPQ